MDTADWLLQSETAWGLPHWLFAVPGILRQVGIATAWVLASWRARRRG